MTSAEDITWSATDDNAFIGELGGMRGVIRAHPQFTLKFEVQIFAHGAAGEPRAFRTMGEATRWVEQELLRLANRC